MYSLLVPH